MKKEYIKPDVEMLKFVETEEIMTLVDDKFSFASTGTPDMLPGMVL